MRTKKALKNLIFNLIQQCITIICGFILPPLIIGKFGSAVNGLISTIKQIMGYAQLTGAGIGASSTFAMYDPIQKKDYEELSGVYNATSVMFKHAGNLFTIVVLILSIVYPFTISGIDYITVACLVIIVGISGISEFYVFGKYQSLITADQNNYIIAIAQAIGNIASVLITILLISFDFSIIIIQLGASIVYLVRILFLMVYIKKKYPFLNKNAKPLIEKLNQRNDAVIHQLSSLVILSSSTLIISVLRGLKEASVFAVYSLVFTGINTICSIVSRAIYASFGDVIAKNEKNILKKSFNIYEFIYFFIISVIFTITYIMIMPFISIYTKNMTDAQYYLPFLAFLFVIVGIANNIRIPAMTIVDAAGHFKKTRNRALIEMTINIIGQLFFGYFFGLYGVLLGCICSYSYRTVDFVIYANKKIIDNTCFLSFKRIIQNIILGVIIAGIIKSLFIISTANYIEWIYVSCIVSIVVLLWYLFFYVFLEKETLLEVFSLLKSLLIR